MIMCTQQAVINYWWRYVSQTAGIQLECHAFCNNSLVSMWTLEWHILDTNHGCSLLPGMIGRRWGWKALHAGKPCRVALPQQL